MPSSLEVMARGYQQLASATSPAGDGEQLFAALERARAEGRPVPRTGDPVAVLRDANSTRGYGPPEPVFLFGRVEAIRTWDEAAGRAVVDVRPPPPPLPEPGTARARNLARSGIPSPTDELLQRIPMGRPGVWRFGCAYPAEAVPPEGLPPEVMRRPSAAPTCGRCGSAARELYLVAAATQAHEFMAVAPIGRRICEACRQALDAWLSPRPALVSEGSHV